VGGLQKSPLGGDWDEDPEGMLCFEEQLRGGDPPPGKPRYVNMCPEEEVDAYAAGTWPINRTHGTATQQSLSADISAPRMRGHL